MRKSRCLAGLAAVAVAAVGFPASAQTSPVPVTLENLAGSREVIVENVDGSTLDKLEFGTNRSLPFKVRVVDDRFDRQGFTVNATMTNLYRLDDAGEIDYSLEEIASSDVTLGSLAGPNALDVKATVQPVLTTVTTITDPAVCLLLGLTVALTGPACQVTETGVLGKVTSLTLPQEVLDSLPKLPLVPQPVTGGKFLNPEFGLNTAGAADPAATDVDPTELRVLGGDASPVDLSALDALVAAIPSVDLIDRTALLAALGDTLPLSKLLPAQVTALLDATTATAANLTLDDILDQTGTYVSLPTLSITTDGADAGSYQGTLVVTAMQ